MNTENSNKHQEIFIFIVKEMAGTKLPSLPLKVPLVLPAHQFSEIPGDRTDLRDWKKTDRLEQMISQIHEGLKRHRYIFLRNSLPGFPTCVGPGKIHE